MLEDQLPGSLGDARDPREHDVVRVISDDTKVASSEASRVALGGSIHGLLADDFVPATPALFGVDRMLTAAGPGRPRPRRAAGYQSSRLHSPAPRYATTPVAPK